MSAVRKPKPLDPVRDPDQRLREAYDSAIDYYRRVIDGAAAPDRDRSWAADSIIRHYEHNTAKGMLG